MGRFCYMPFVNFESNADGSCTVCCKISKLGNHNLITDSIQDIWKAKEFQLLRDKFINGEEPSECQICWTEESTGNITTPRIQSLVWKDIADIRDPKIRYLTFKLSSRCNMACRICNPWLSTTWEQQFEQLGWKAPLGKHHQIFFENAKTKKFNNDANVKFIKETIPDLLAVNAYGGEPFLQEEFFEFIKWCEELDAPKNISLGLSTNGSVITPEIMKMLTQFKLVNMHISVDDVFKRYEYNRWPVKWSKISENLKLWATLHDERNHWSGRKITLSPTFSILNMFYIDEIVETLSQFGLPISISNFVHAPEQFSIRNAPEKFKDAVKEKIEKIDFDKYEIYPRAAKKGHISLPTVDHKQVLLAHLSLPAQGAYEDPGYFAYKLKETLDPVDKLRGQRFEDYCPEVHKILYG